MGDIKVLDFGQHGVVLTKDPLHVETGDLHQAQNAVRSKDKGITALESRPGMTRVNSSAMTGGSVLGFTAMPFRDPGNLPLSIYAPIAQVVDAVVAVSYDDGGTWRSIASGSTDPWILSGKYLAVLGYLAGWDIPLYRRAVTIDGRVVYAGDGYTQYPNANHVAPPIFAFDGSLASELGRIPYSPAQGAGTNAYAITCFGFHEGEIYVATWDTGAGGGPVAAGPNMGGRVLKLDAQTGQLTQIGNAFGGGAGENAGGTPVCLASHNGRLWAGTYDDVAAGTGKVWWIRPGLDSTWTLDHTTAASKGYIVDLISYKGELFALTLGEVGTASVVLKRTPSGTWSDSDTNASTAANNAFTSPVVYNNELYVWMDGGTASAVHRIRKFDGTSWSTDADLNALFGFAGSSVDPGMALVLNSDIFIAHDDGVLRRHLGTWSRALDLAGLLLHGELAFTNVEYS